MEIIRRPTKEIIPYEMNARYNVDTVRALKASIKKYGFNQPIVIDQHNVIIKGHARHQAALELGMDDVPCIISTNSAELNNADRLADNLIHELTTWDDESLRSEIRDISDAVDAVMGYKFGQESYAPELMFNTISDEHLEKAARKIAGTASGPKKFYVYHCKCGHDVMLSVDSVEALK
jgi:hypothetical protein